MKKITLLLLLSISGLAIGQNSCATAAVAVNGNNVIVEVNGSQAPIDCSNSFDPVAGAEWYKFTATLTGVATISSVLPMNSENNDTRLHAYSGICGDLQCIAFNDDYDVAIDEDLSEVTFEIVQGETYYFAWDNYWTEEGFTFSLAQTQVDCSTTIPYSENFSDISRWLACYERADIDGNENDFIREFADLDNNEQSLAYVTNATPSTAAQNDWMFSPAFALTQGIPYTVTVTYNGLDRGNSAALENLEVFMTNAPNAAAGFQQLLGSYAQIGQTGTLVEVESQATTQQPADFVPATSGNYHIGFHVTSAANTGYLAIFGYTISVSLGSADNAVVPFRLYPNPTKDLLTLEQEQNMQQLEIFNMLGQSLLSKTVDERQITVDVSGLPSGTYLVKAKSASGSKTARFVKQ